MARFRGKIGFVQSREVSPGVWDSTPLERTYRGDILKNNVRWQSTSELNDNIVISNRISIVADTYANEHAGYIRYIYWMNQPYTVTSIEVSYPRLVLSIGGIYNGPTA